MLILQAQVDQDAGDANSDKDPNAWYCPTLSLEEVPLPQRPEGLWAFNFVFANATGPKIAISQLPGIDLRRTQNRIGGLLTSVVSCPAVLAGKRGRVEWIWPFQWCIDAAWVLRRERPCGTGTIGHARAMSHVD